MTRKTKRLLVVSCIASLVSLTALDANVNTSLKASTEATTLKEEVLYYQDFNQYANGDDAMTMWGKDSFFAFDTNNSTAVAKTREDGRHGVELALHGVQHGQIIVMGTSQVGCLANIVENEYYTFSMYVDVTNLGNDHSIYFSYGEGWQIGVHLYGDGSIVNERPDNGFNPRYENGILSFDFRAVASASYMYCNAAVNVSADDVIFIDDFKITKYRDTSVQGTFNAQDTILVKKGETNASLTGTLTYSNNDVRNLDTSEILIDDANVDYNVEGIYTATAYVIDEAGRKLTDEVKVVVSNIQATESTLNPLYYSSFEQFENGDDAITMWNKDNFFWCNDAGAIATTKTREDGRHGVEFDLTGTQHTQIFGMGSSQAGFLSQIVENEIYRFSMYVDVTNLGNDHSIYFSYGEGWQIGVHLYGDGSIVNERPDNGFNPRYENGILSFDFRAVASASYMYCNAAVNVSANDVVFFDDFTISRVRETSEMASFDVIDAIEVSSKEEITSKLLGTLTYSNSEVINVTGTEMIVDADKYGNFEVEGTYAVPVYVVDEALNVYYDVVNITVNAKQHNINQVESYMNLAYRYTVVTENDVTTYPTSEFRLQVGVDASIVDIAASYANASWGIEVSTETKTMKFDEVVKEDGTIKYVVIGLGDVLNNTNRAKDVFTARAYIEVDGVTYYSEAVKSYSVAQMIAEYKTQGKPVDGMYQAFVDAGLYA